MTGKKVMSVASLTDYIEEYLKKLLAISTRNYVEIRRAELARKFSCVPSQVNYVLRSRFSPARGYLVESRRGGSGYIRIYRIVHPQGRSWVEIWREMESTPFEPTRAKQFLKLILEENALSRREAQMINTLLQDKHYEGLDLDEAREMQKRLFRASLEAILKSSY
ncbi:MAG: CtsR family transcriptional regulator [Firmicutes bacterium]|nr:CtsR family transcriptional regulator [Bacillota bacterium]